MEDLINYKCLKCGAEWSRPEDKDPAGVCPGCRTYDYDKPRRGQGLKICSVCHREFFGNTSAHGKPALCSPQCTEKWRNSRPGVFI